MNDVVKILVSNYNNCVDCNKGKETNVFKTISSQETGGMGIEDALAVARIALRICKCYLIQHK